MKRKRKLRKSVKLILLSLLIVIVIIFIKDYRENKASIDAANKDIDAIAYLQKEKQNDKQIQKILENKDEYPKVLLEMLARNPDMKEYVLNYLDLKGKVLSDNIGEVKKGVFPKLLQYDKRWGYGIYGNETIAIEGCGPTSLAMVIAGLTGRNDITPHNIAEYALKNGYYDNGTSWTLFTKGALHYKIEGREISLSEDIIKNELNMGHPIICSVRKGDFTTTGHIIVIVGLKGDKLIINDPNSAERSNKLWEYSKIKNQIKNLWSFKAV